MEHVVLGAEDDSGKAAGGEHLSCKHCPWDGFITDCREEETTRLSDGSHFLFYFCPSCRSCLKYKFKEGVEGAASTDKELDATDRILCKECKWDGFVTECAAEELTDVAPNITVLLCPACDHPLARKMGSQITLTERNAVIMQKF